MFMFNKSDNDSVWEPKDQSLVRTSGWILFFGAIGLPAILILLTFYDPETWMGIAVIGIALDFLITPIAFFLVWRKGWYG